MITSAWRSLGPMWLGFMIIFMALLYFMLFRPQQKKEKARRALIEATKSGDRVIFGGGLIGTVANVKEYTFVIKIADNVKVEVLRGAVTRTLERGEKPEESEEK